jgi:prephenate dehydrogenase
MTVNADLIVLAVPVRKIISLIKEMGAFISDEVILLDLGSTKSQILEAMRDLPENFDPIGGHPMAGKEKSSFKYADAEIYLGANFFLSPLERTSKHAIKIIEDLVISIGSVPVQIDANEHDRWVSLTSHVPYLLSIALSSITDMEAARFIGPGYRSMTRLASSDIEMATDIMETNRDNILDILNKFSNQLDNLGRILESGNEEKMKQTINSSLENLLMLNEYETN